MIPGFVVAADAIVACPACGAAVGSPCDATGRERAGALQPGHVHFGRRVRRLLLTASAAPGERLQIERELVELLREELLERAKKKKRR